MRREASARRRQIGFSMVEIVITLLVSAILVRLAAPSFGNWVGNQRIRTTAEAVLHGLNLARAEALRRNARVLFSMQGDNGGESAWQVCPVGQGMLACDPLQPVIQVRDGGEESVNARIGATTNAGLVVPGSFGSGLTPGAGVPVAVMFNGRGRLVNAAGWVNTVRVDVRNLSLDAAEERRLVVVVNASGGARMCDPQSAAGNPRAC